MTLSKMQSEISAALSEPTRSEDGSYKANLCFPPTFTGFEGHFPDNPIVPAVCLISTIEIMARRCTDLTGKTLLKIIQAKLRAPILPNQNVVVSATIENQQITARILGDDPTQTSVIKLLFT